MNEENHDISLAVWDVPSPVIAGRRATLKAGITCPSGCDLTGTRIDVYDETGARVGAGEAGSVPWPATDALYWAELEVSAPGREGDHSWSVRATAPDAPHGHAASVLRFVASRPPEHHVTLEVIDKGSGLPIGGVELRVGGFRTATSETGIAHVVVPGGTYDVCAWKIGYALLSTTVDVAGDATIQLEVTTAPEPEQPYWM